MRFFTALAAGVLAMGANAQNEPITSPFYLTVIIDGEELPTNIAPVSRGVPILTPATEYNQLFTFNTTTKRIYSFDRPNMGGSFQLDAGLPVIFDATEPAKDSALEQFGEDGAIFLVKEGTSELGTEGWQTQADESTFPTNFFWPGQGEEANAKLRIDLKAPTS